MTAVRFGGFRFDDGYFDGRSPIVDKITLVACAIFVVIGLALSWVFRSGGRPQTPLAIRPPAVNPAPFVDRGRFSPRIQGSGPLPPEGRGFPPPIQGRGAQMPLGRGPIPYRPARH